MTKQNSPPHTHFLQYATSLVSLMSFKSLMSLTSPQTAGLPKAVVDAKEQQKASLQKKIFGLSIFLFAQNLWRAVMKNGDIQYAHRR